MLADKIVLLEQIENQPPNTSDPLPGIPGVPKFTIAPSSKRNCELWTLRHRQQDTSEKQDCEGRDPDVEEAINQWFSFITE